ncbi:sulfurtransferase [Streptosporangium canum]|uniref:Thiosulfate/3-mercaptopyruvate sulfurtransferase n=1 Tax=Streptosporangium canum TaxID=324952 RepID=A0A1I4AS16_9ACTN|nr:sulfurtransferase [Streptosporangium canum]SFK59338.1 thiosulfate/3-mercaptopyruvate sulfurtransferase [Streptosporangium canum]
MSLLITPSELADLAGATVLDVRWKLGGPPGADSYREGHVPGAVFCDLNADLAAPAGPGGRHPLPSADLFQDAMRRLGVSGSRTVVVYDGADSTAAARAWWTLRYFGHPDVRVLDGGFHAWAAEGLPVATGEETASPGDFVARPGGMPVLDAAQALELAADGVLLDARAAERYRGEVEPIDPVAGHVPGAVSAPTGDNVDPAGRFHLPDFLRERFNTLGAVPGVRVGAYCGSGVTAAHEVLALELAGIPAALYVGSWSNWVADPSRPVATG